jgi:aspartyl-tRNA(Asn)/glutamyl-tRNA(Gln) amidotransferase subunit B
MELVTEPVIHDAETAGAFARELQLLLRTLGASEANLEKGQMRIEANISVSNEEGKFGTKVEVKNINSFRAVERAIKYEIERQTKTLEAGEKLVQETRGWDEGKQQTFHQRFKEGSADYRYFPEPDIPKLKLSDDAELSLDAVKASLPELPWARRTRYAAFGLSSDNVAYLLAISSRSTFFDGVIEASEGDAGLVKAAANFIATDIAGAETAGMEEPLARITPDSLVQLARMAQAGDLSSRGAKDTLAAMLAEGGAPEAVAKAKGLIQVHDEGALQAAVEAVIAANPGVAAEYRGGKAASLQFLVGQAMKATKGAGNPGKLKELLEKALQ